MDRKGQSSNAAGMAIVTAFIVLAVIGVVQLISITITSKVGASIEDSLPLDTLTTSNETINLTFIGASDNSTLLAENGFVINSEIVANATNSSKILVRDTDYSINLIGTSGAIGTTANFTFLQPGAAAAYNITEVKITYETKEETAYHITKAKLQSDNLSSLELSGTAQIVFASIVVLISVFGILAIMKSRG